MLKKDAIRILGTQRAVADAAGVRPPSVSGWGDIVPAAAALRLAQAYPTIPLRIEDYAAAPRETA